MKTLLILAVTLSLNFSCGNTKSTTQQDVRQNQITKSVVDTPTTQSNEVTKKYGFQFSIPKYWVTKMEDFKSVDLKGQVKTIESFYVDNDTQSRIRLIYHPGKPGMTLYKYYSENTSVKTQPILIAKQSAFKIDETLTHDGKGHLLPEPYIRHKIYVMSPNHKGLLEIVYDLPKNNTKAKSEFEHFVQQIKTVE